MCDDVRQELVQSAAVPMRNYWQSVGPVSRPGAGVDIVHILTWTGDDLLAAAAGLAALLAHLAVHHRAGRGYLGLTRRHQGRG